MSWGTPQRGYLGQLGQVLRQFLRWAWQFAGHWGRETLYNIYWFLPFYGVVVLVLIIFPDLQQEIWEDMVLYNPLLFALMMATPIWAITIPSALWIVWWRYYRRSLWYFAIGILLSLLPVAFIQTLSLPFISRYIQFVWMGLTLIPIVALEAYLAMGLYKIVMRIALPFSRFLS